MPISGDQTPALATGGGATLARVGSGAVRGSCGAAGGAGRDWSGGCCVYSEEAGCAEIGDAITDFCCWWCGGRCCVVDILSEAIAAAFVMSLLALLARLDNTMILFAPNLLL
jgi:hypothetical protein